MMNNGEQCGCKCGHWLRAVGMVFGILFVISVTVFFVFMTRNQMKSFDYIGQNPQSISQITISGTAKIMAVPDVATLTVGAWTTNVNVATAQKNNTEKMNSIIAALKKLGVAEKDLKTSSYNIYPEYDWINDVSTFKDYRVEQNLDIKIRDTAKISDVLNAIGTLKADYIGQLAFTVDDIEKIKQQAKVEAIKDAKAKASEMSATLGVKLGKVMNFSDSSYTPIPFDYSYGVKSSELAMPSAAPAPSIQTGESEITSNVSITFELL